MDGVFRSIHRRPAYQVRFGTKELTPAAGEFARIRPSCDNVMNHTQPIAPRAIRLSNLDRGQPEREHPQGHAGWHTRVVARGTGRYIIYAEVVAGEGGETHFCDMYCAFERLNPEWKKRVANMRAVHNLDFSRTRRHGDEPMTEAQRREVPPVDHPIVRTHPDTGRRCLFLGDHAEYIAGMGYDEGRALIDELNALAVHPDLAYEHRWTPGELIVWDNRCLMHRATVRPAAQRRVVG